MPRHLLWKEYRIPINTLPEILSLLPGNRNFTKVTWKCIDREASFTFLVTGKETSFPYSSLFQTFLCLLFGNCSEKCGWLARKAQFYHSLGEGWVIMFGNNNANKICLTQAILELGQSFKTGKPLDKYSKIEFFKVGVNFLQIKWNLTHMYYQL